MTIWSIALTFFLVANPIGNIPAFVALLKDFDFHRQKKILFRESLFSYGIAIFFLFIGDQFLRAIHVQQYAVYLSGGTLLFLIALNMIFPAKSSSSTAAAPVEPFIVPIATPLLAGGGVLSTIMIYSAKEQNDIKLALAATIAWVAITFVVVSSAYLQKILKRRGLLAIEQLMGMLLCMMAVEIVVKGIKLFIRSV
ncbi:MAG: MarC family protein [Verrucomicrobia bacterium]|nr:MarC family protein [Verrucomicrobiota bacterium]